MEEREVSNQFYDYMCGIVGSEEVVKERRKVFMALDNVMENLQQTFISSGSKAEGLDKEGSDYDLMIVEKDIGVYESVHAVSSFLHELTLLMDTIHTKPGFTKLKAYKASEAYLQILYKWCETFQQELYISSDLYRKYRLPKRDTMIIHGPCVSSKYNLYDVAYSFRCMEWVKPAKQWINRSRCTWPDNELTQSIIKFGVTVLFVPVVFKGSVNEDLEWRISFSVAERQLIYSFSHTQLLCYALLKFLLNDFIKKEHKDLICSYFLQTIMFWLCEESSPNIWKSDNLVACFISCWKRLLYCVEYETCLHYFIPDNNLFEGRFSPKQRNSLLDTLHNIDHSPWNYVFYSETFANYRRKQRNSLSTNLTTSSLSCLVYFHVLLPIFCTSTSFKQVLIRAVNQHGKHISTHLLSTAAMRLMHDCLNLREKNVLFYRQYQIMLRYLCTVMYNSSVQAWALLASLFYKCN